MQYVTKRPNLDGKKILIVRLDRLGDLLVSTPGIHVIKQSFPNARLHMLASTLNASVLPYCMCFEKTFVYDKKRPFHAIKTFLELKKEQYDAIICLAPHSRSCNLFVKFLSAPMKLAFFTPPKKYERIYTHSTPLSQKTHIMELFQENAVNMGFETPKLYPVLDIPAYKKEKVNAEFPKKTQVMRICISLGNIKREHKRWDSKKYAEVVQSLYTKYNKNVPILDIQIMTGTSDLPLLEEFKNIPKEYYSVYIGTDLAESAMFIENCDLFVCTSSGPSHIAASTSCPILSLINSYMYDVWRPLRENDRCIVSDPIQDISVEEVLGAITAYIAEWQDRQSIADK